MISSKVFERWLISITDMPTPGSDNISLCASSKTGTGITAGPALKLKIRSVINYFGVRRLDAALFGCCFEKREIQSAVKPAHSKFILSQNDCAAPRPLLAARASVAQGARSQP